MNKSDLIDAVAAKTNQSKKDTAAAVDAVLESIKGAVSKGDKVLLVGFGSFERVQRAARVGTNPKTGDRIDVPAKTAPKAKLTFKL